MRRRLRSRRDAAEDMAAQAQAMAGPSPRDPAEADVSDAAAVDEVLGTGEMPDMLRADFALLTKDAEDFEAEMSGLGVDHVLTLSELYPDTDFAEIDRKLARGVAHRPEVPGPDGSEPRRGPATWSGVFLAQDAKADLLAGLDKGLAETKTRHGAALGAAGGRRRDLPQDHRRTGAQRVEAGGTQVRVRRSRRRRGFQGPGPAHRRDRRGSRPAARSARRGQGGGRAGDARRGGEEVTAPPRTAGVLGGMGPAATLDFMARVQALRAGGRDQDHVRLIVDLNPAVPDRNAAVAGRGRRRGRRWRRWRGGWRRRGRTSWSCPATRRTPSPRRSAGPAGCRCST